MKKTLSVLMLGLISITFSMDAEAAKKSKGRLHRKSHAALKHQAAKKKKLAAAKPARMPAAVKAEPKHEQIDMTATIAQAEKATIVARDLNNDPNRPLTW